MSAASGNVCQCAYHARERELLEQIAKLEAELKPLRELARAASEFCDCPHDAFGCDASLASSARSDADRSVRLARWNRSLGLGRLR